VRAAALGLLWGGAGVALVASGQSWWTAGTSTESGATATSGAALVLVLAALAGAFLSNFLRATARRIVGGLVVLLLAGALIVALGASTPVTLGTSTLTDAVVTPTAWRWGYLIGVVLAAVGAVLILFTRPRTARPSATPDQAMDAWKALDAGDDPTAPDERVTGGEGPRDQQQ
jgi:hypothetical protein